jgi:hypothetical protein
MNPTLPEEAGQTARSFIDAMKTQPALLAMIFTNIGMLVFIFYALHAAATFRESLVNRVLANAQAIHQNTAALQERSVACPPSGK